MCVIYPNSMVYLSVQFYTLCSVFSGVILSFNTKCLIMSHTTLNVNSFPVFYGFHYNYLKSSSPISCHCPISISPENMRKLLVFWCLQGIKKNTNGINWVNENLIFVLCSKLAKENQNGRIDTFPKLFCSPFWYFLVLFLVPCYCIKYAKIRVSLTSIFRYNCRIVDSVLIR